MNDEIGRFILTTFFWSIAAFLLVGIWKPKWRTAWHGDRTGGRRNSAAGQLVAAIFFITLGLGPALNNFNVFKIVPIVMLAVIIVAIIDVNRQR
jgi:hypothetical protein